jgi:hypothetical protein
MKGVLTGHAREIVAAPLPSGNPGIAGCFANTCSKCQTSLCLEISRLDGLPGKSLSSGTAQGIFPMNLRIGILSPLLLLGGFAALSWCLGGFFNQTEVCTHCGEIRHTRRVLWMPFSKTLATPLSSYQQSLGESAAQPHQWMFASGSGGPIRCALGSGRELHRSIRSPEIVQALKSIRQHRGDVVAKQWTARLLDPKTSANAHLALFMLSASDSDFDSDYATAAEEFKVSQEPPIH